MLIMARGWESKSVEAQRDEAEASRQSEHKQSLSPDEAEKLRQRELIAMSRQRIAQLISTATNERYRRLLEQELAALDKKLASERSDQLADR
jgi:hypothetical protein